MTAPHPIYTDGAYLYTLRRDGGRYAIYMRHARGGPGHLIAIEGMVALPAALWVLREYAARYGLRRRRR